MSQLLCARGVAILTTAGQQKASIAYLCSSESNSPVQVVEQLSIEMRHLIHCCAALELSVSQVMGPMHMAARKPEGFAFTPSYH